MDFKLQQDSIIDYIKNNYPTALQSFGLTNMDAYIDDFLDFDKYTKKKQLFFGFNQYDFEALSNESKQEDFEFSIYLVFKNDKTENLRNQMLDYASAFNKMFVDSGNNLGGIADYGEITTINFYPATEGLTNQKVAEITIHLYTERE